MAAVSSEPEGAPGGDLGPPPADAAGPGMTPLSPAEAARLVSHPPIDPASLRPTKTWGVRSAAEADEISSRELRFFALSTILEKGMIPGLESYNWLLNKGIRQIFREQFHIRKRFENTREGDAHITAVDLDLKFVDVELGLPTHTADLATAGAKLPSHARVARGTAGNLAAPLKLRVEATLTAVTRGEPASVTARTSLTPVGDIPVLVRSARCHTYTMAPTTLRLAGEDPADPGGYAIIGGNEYSVEITENIVYNNILVYLASAPGEVARAQFISQAGGAFDNSSQLVVRQMNSGGITLELSSQFFTSKASVRIPFFLIYRMLGAKTDREAVNTVVFGDVEGSSPMNQQMLDWLDEAYRAEYKGFEDMHRVTEHERVVLETADRLMPPRVQSAPKGASAKPGAAAGKRGAAAREADDAYRFQQILEVFDTQFIPHVGTGSESRPEKLRLLGLMIRRMFLVRLGAIPPTDRDSYEQKRVHDAGLTVAKSLKRAINDGIIAPLYGKIRNILEANSFGSIRPALLVQAIQNTLFKSKLSQNIASAITSGYRSGGRRGAASRPTRLNSQALERKNALNTAATLRTVHTQGSSDSKHTQRGTDRRQIHPSYAGFICPLRSADTGEAVGMTKEQAISTKISREEDPALLKAALRADPGVQLFEDGGYASYGPDAAAPLTIVFVNGDWIGGTPDPQGLVKRYRELRREGRYVPTTATIAWNSAAATVTFHVDAGRLLRPLLIVDNNQVAFDVAARAGKPIPFEQAPAATEALLRGIRTGAARMDDLVAAGIAEWVAPEEQANARIAEDMDLLRSRRGDVLVPYTHVEIPLALLSLTALANVFPEFSQPARATYSTNQMRQACGQFVANPHGPRVDNGRFFMYVVQRPLVSGIGHSFVGPAGLNVPVGYYCWKGWGQEDSTIVNRAAVQRGAFAGLYFAVVRADLQKGERYGPPDPLKTPRTRPGATYGKLGPSGFPPAGTILEPNDAAIGVVGQNTGPDHAAYPHIDRSRVYTRDEPARVVESFPSTGAVKYSISRDLGVGDKTSCYIQGYGVLVCRDGGVEGWVPLEDVVVGDRIAVPPKDAFVEDGTGAVDLIHYSTVQETHVGPMPDYLVEVWVEGHADEKHVVTENHRVPLAVGVAGACTARWFTADDLAVLADPETNRLPDDLAVWGADGKPLGLGHLCAKRRGSTAIDGETVHCVTVPGDVFLCRLEAGEGGGTWTGNSRSGNKAIVAFLASPADIPRTADGYCASFIVNPHSFPTRMILGQIMEAGAASTAARTGVTFDGTAWSGASIQRIAHGMLGCGLNVKNGRQLFDSRLGMPLDQQTHVGMTFEQRLLKFAYDERYAAPANGPRDPVTAQPVPGKASGGANRMGEMEMWTILTQGNMAVAREKLWLHSDGMPVAHCRRCGGIAIAAPERNYESCLRCGDAADPAVVYGRRSAVAFEHEIGAVVDYRVHPAPRSYEVAQ